jgi:uncharacterized membrane protein
MMMFARHEPALARSSAATFGAGVVGLGLCWLVRGDVLAGLGTWSLATPFVILMVGAGTSRERATLLAIALMICAVSHAADFGLRRRVALAAGAGSVLLLASIALAVHVRAIAAGAFALHAVLGATIVFTSPGAIGIARVRRALGSPADSTR